MRIAVGQTPRFRGIEEGVEWLLSRLPRADVLILPEYWVGTRPLSGEEFQKYVSAMAHVAEALGGVVVAGAVAVEFGPHVKNVCPVVGGGGLVSLGEKIFPAAATGERERVVGGSRLALFKVRDWAVGCLVCVDILYPELARRLVLAGAEVLVNPASVSSDRRSLWEAVGLTRAFENSVYVAAALGTGYLYADGRPVEGGSFVASPNGSLLRFGSEPGVYTAELDKAEVHYARSRRRFLDDLERVGRVNV
ncbi:carbon-nitrogen hydrolase family protein [Pyrobaculum calidifontis]|uniref:Nitrilase/cyanide hydratase and apolipoprotein N-acyltransferase n=1 Tax=Pyrobaculum calidifontis (strain DSM 21063 / JCM 11548 / VA1) TaxID=410359 RepID=A3MWX0_PYRCJ|nr:carbon-nitrogen hydrolase family protein [Pyrobaculum calidifontis]ABO09137.1 Nitrilase/cyanide hydratase and apolipoprotein N-acyltransferase [Pyrobaculum calidifontis JCM 11548]